MKLTLRPTIFSNGLILISIPLVFELAFAGTLFVLQQDYEKKLQAQIHSTAVISHTNEMWLAVMDLIVGSFATKVFPQKTLHTRFHFNKIDVEYHELSKLLAKEDPNQLPKLHRMWVRANALVKLSQSFADPDLMGGVAGLRGDLVQFQHLQLMIKHLGDDMVAFREPWQRRTEQAESAMDEARKTITTVTIAGVILSIILAALLFSYFIRGIYSGISNLTENTLRFARKEELLPLSNRTDELAQVDRIFHEMAAYVEVAAMDKEKLQQLKQDFFHMITHDMRTPLSSLVLSIESLSLGLAGEVSEEAMPTLGSAERSVNMLMNLITDLLDLETAESQGIKLHMEEFDIREVLDEVVDVVEFMADRVGITLKIECSADTLYADRIRILRVLTNLVTNAIKFSPQDSTITLTAKAEGHKIDFEVIDQGRGVPQEQRKKIFDRFHQVEKDDSRKKKGSGLGLSIAKTFVEGHGGRIGVESEGGKGSKFWFWIPKIVTKTTKPETSSESSQEPLPLSKDSQKHQENSQTLPENFPNSA